MRFLKPFALTGRLVRDSDERQHAQHDDREGTGNKKSSSSAIRTSLEWGFALEYSIPYLQSQVQDMHWGAPFDRLIPLVEFALETPLNRGAGGQTTGTINPGVIWAGQHFQFGVEAMFPSTSAPAITSA